VTIVRSMEAATESQAREEMCRLGKSLFDRGYVHATAGNISVRLSDGFLMTPSDACLGFLDPATLAKLDSSGQQLSGATASKTLALHRAIYQATQGVDPKTACVIHTHSTHCVALSLRKLGPGPSELLPAITPYFVMKVGRVPLIEYHRPGSELAAKAVAEKITEYAARQTPIRAVMLARLGPNVWHQSPAATMAVLEELEETAKLSLAQPDAEPLGETQIDELRHFFGARW
jgi:3-dehydro-4-phosphotetronate decarboxylase